MAPDLSAIGMVRARLRCICTRNGTDRSVTRLRMVQINEHRLIHLGNAAIYRARARPRLHQAPAPFSARGHSVTPSLPLASSTLSQIRGCADSTAAPPHGRTLRLMRCASVKGPIHGRRWRCRSTGTKRRYDWCRKGAVAVTYFHPGVNPAMMG